MEHIKAVCKVLGISVDEAMDEAPLEAVTDEEQAMLKRMRALDPAQTQLLLVLASNLEKKS